MLIIDTHYPKGIYEISIIDNQIIIKATNNDNYKINNQEQHIFMVKLLSNIKIKGQLHGNLKCKDCFVSLEDLRNIHYGIIDDLTNDNSTPSINKIAGFGYLCGDTKPYRLKYMDYCNTYPHVLEYISTNKYSPNDPSMFSFVDMKKYRYLIDVPGHTYSTKLYSFLHSKRVIFKLKHVNKEHDFYWETFVKPNIHYIEIEPDYSDIIEKFNYLQENPQVEQKIIQNCQELVSTLLTPEILTNHFLECLDKCWDK
jgi:hypothetical protein